MSGLTTQDIDYLKQQAQSRGYDPQNLLRVINYESSGRPNIWGGKNKNYFGLIQFGPEERKQFGVDTVNPNAKNQIDATFKYLDARGYKPGMGLLDLYSTVNAGSPGHYKASDGNGTVASHVATMLNTPVPQNASVSEPIQLPSAAPNTQNNDKPDQIAEYLDNQDKEQSKSFDQIGQYGLGLLGNNQNKYQLLSPTPIMQPMQFQQGRAHIPNPQQFAGLLGR